MPSAPPSKRRPHLYFARGSSPCWYCLDGLWLGWGATPRSAYDHWKQRDIDRSCVHDRETPLQRRRREAIQRDLIQHAKV
jgi:hypothetical protein